MATKYDVEPWLDTEKLIPGQNWRQQITNAVEASDVVLVCLSRTSVTKEGFVQREIKLALDKAEEKLGEAIFIVPVRLEDYNVPDELRKWQWVNLYESNGYWHLKNALLERAKQRNVMSPLTLWVVQCIECWHEDGEDEWMMQDRAGTIVLPAYECEHLCQKAVDQIVDHKGCHKPRPLRVNADDYFNYLAAHPGLVGNLFWSDGTVSATQKPVKKSGSRQTLKRVKPGSRQRS
jgi:hypothetical protein